jgi:flagellar basal-body rod protein FlgF
MVRGLYTAYTGMINQQNRLDTITNNLANSSTTGYKREGATTQSFDDVLTIKVKDGSENYINRSIGTMSLGAKIGENYTDYSQGSFRETDNTYDLALEGNGFFSISYTNKNGETSTKYTRSGEFTVDSNGALRTKEGDYVLGQNGIIYIPTNASSVSIDSLGNITADGTYVDRLNIVDFADYNYLSKFGENLYDAVDGAQMVDAQCQVHQGYLEASNINVVKEMVEMINITRAYETNQKVIQAIDETLDKSVNSIGAV